MLFIQLTHANIDFCELNTLILSEMKTFNLNNNGTWFKTMKLAHGTVHITNLCKYVFGISDIKPREPTRPGIVWSDQTIEGKLVSIINKVVQFVYNLVSVLQFFCRACPTPKCTLSCHIRWTVLTNPFAFHKIYEPQCHISM